MNLIDKIDTYLGEAKTYTDDDWVLVQDGKVVKYIKNPKNDKAPESFTSSKNQEIIRVSKAKQMGICEGLDPAYYAKQIQAAKGDSNRLSNLKSTIKSMGEGRMLSSGDVRHLCDMIDRIRGKK